MSNNKTWSNPKRDYVETPKSLIEFLNDIEEVCKKHNLSIANEDNQGGFIINKFKEENIKWLKEASIDYEEDESNNTI